MALSYCRSLGFSLLILVAVAGCERSSQQAQQAAAHRSPGTPAAVPAGFVLTAAPADAKDLTAAKAAVKDGDEVVVNAVVGGSQEPFTANQAVMQVIDPSVQTCDKMGMSKNDCATPWDACCHQADVKKNDATVRAVGSDGKPLAGTLEGLGGIAPGKMLVVKGKAHVQDGKLTIDATNVFVKG
jgi:hypothetical protein